MRFFALALLVAGAYAANETCEDINGDGTADDAFVCPTGYTTKGGAADIAQATADSDETAKRTACCDANQVNFTGDANSDETGTTAVVVDATPLTVTCNAGYESGGNPSYDVGVNAAGDALTGNGTPCAAKTGDFAGDAKSDVNASTTLTFDATATTVTCNDGYQVANAAADGFQATYTVALAADGTATTFVPATASAGCAAKTYAIGAVFTVEGTVTVAIPNSNFAVLTTTATYDQGSLTFACDTGYTAVDTVTATFATETFTNGNGKLTVADTATTATAADKICVKDAPAPAPASAPAAGSAGSVADSATDSSASPAALAAAGMAAIALLL